MMPWHALQDGFVRCASSRSRTVLAVSPFDVLDERLDVRRRRRRRACQGRSRAATGPRSTGEVRFGYDDTSSTPPLPSKPKRLLVVELDAAEALAAHVVDAVVQREALVQERVVGRQEIEHAAVLAEDAVDEQPRLGRRSASRMSRSTSANTDGSGARLSSSPSPSH